MNIPEGKLTIAEASDKWIEMIQSPETQATPEQKEALVAKIRMATPKTMVPVLDQRGFFAGNKAATTQTFGFVEATGYIKKAMK